MLANAERVDGCAGPPTGELCDDERAALTQLVSVWRKVEELAGPGSRVCAASRRARRGKAQLEDLASFLRAYADGVDASPAKLQEVEDRLARIERLKRKYGPALEDVVAKGQALRAEASRLTGGDEESGDVERQLAAASTAYVTAARELPQTPRLTSSHSRASRKTPLAGNAMAETRFDVRFESTEAEPDRWEPHGLDRVEFYVSPNPGEDPRPLARVASGGELSRIMLALRTHGTRRPGRGSAQTGGRKTPSSTRWTPASAGGRPGGGRAARARRAPSGAVHHAPRADRGAGTTVRRREASPADGP